MLNRSNLGSDIAKMRSLMERMEQPHTARQAMLNEQRHLDEAQQPKMAVTRDQIIDILDQQDNKGNAGLYSYIVYIKACPVYKTKRKGSWRPEDVDAMLSQTKDKYGEADWHKELTDYNKETVKSSTPNPISTVLAVTKWKLHWTTKDNYNKSYSDYSTKLHNLRMSYKLGMDSDGMLGDNHNQRQDIGDTQMNQTGNLSKDFNIASTETDIRQDYMYRVDSNGHVVDELPAEVIKAMSAIRKPKGPEKEAVEKLTPEELEAYMTAKKELDKEFSPMTLNFDGMLAISANVDGTSYYYINDKAILTTKERFDVNAQDLVKIAERLIGQKFVPITGFEHY